MMSLFAKFTVDPGDLVSFATNSASCRVGAFLRQWRDYGSLVTNDPDSWIDSLNKHIAMSPTLSDPDHILAGLQVRSGSDYPIVSGDSSSAEHLHMNEWEQSRFATTPGAVVLHPGDTARQVFEILEPVLSISVEVRIVDRYLASCMGGRDLDRKGLALFLRKFRTYHDDPSVKVVCAADGRGATTKYGGRSLKTATDQRAGSALCIQDEIARAAGIGIGYYGLSWDKIVEKCHDRFIAFACRESNAQRSVQIGVGTGAFADKEHPITLSRVRHSDFETIWSSLTRIAEFPGNVLAA